MQLKHSKFTLNCMFPNSLPRLLYLLIPAKAQTNAFRTTLDFFLDLKPHECHERLIIATSTYKHNLTILPTDSSFSLLHYYNSILRDNFIAFSIV